MSRESRRPQIVAHRGASADAPENTIAAFELAIAQGADGIELDVHLSRDDQPVVLHDFTLERTTDGAGPVRLRTVRELKRLDAGGWRASQFKGQRVQTLQEVLERFRGRARFWIELKGGSDLYPGIEERVLSTLEVYDVLETSLVQSFDLDALARIRGLSREARLGALVSRWPIELDRVSGASALCPEASMVNRAMIEQLREAGLESYVWTVNEPAQADRLVECGVSGLITDRPGALRARLGP